MTSALCGGNPYCKLLTHLSVSRVPADVKSKVEAKLQELKDAIATDNTSQIKDAQNALQQEVMTLGQSLYNQPGAGAPGGEQPGAGPNPSSSSPKGGDDGEVIDADFTDSK
jgi:heat shock protein 1/8